jgi:hypothetical protein
MICGFVDHRSGKHSRSAHTISTEEPSTAAAQECLRPLLPTPTGLSDGPPDTTSTAAAQECLRPLLQQQQATDRSPVKIAIAEQLTKDRYNRHCHRLQEWILPMVIGTSKSPAKQGSQCAHRTTEPWNSTYYYYRGSQESLSPHARTLTRERSNSLHRKNSTLRIPAEQLSPR